MTLSVVMVTKNSGDVVEGAMKSIEGMWDELLVGDGGSRDGTAEIIRKYGANVIQTNPTNLPIRPINKTIRHNVKNERMDKKNLGERKQELVEKAKGDWILVLDADERVSEELKEEIEKVVGRNRRLDPRLRGDDRRGGGDDHKQSRNDKNCVAYRIPYQNYVFGWPVYYGGEHYAKVRLFRRGYGRISPEPLHEEVKVKGEIGELKGKIHHHSYRSPWQLLSKFTWYAWVASGMDPRLRGDDILRKLFLYGPHMFWARFVKESGYKDGWRGLVLATGFAYMEGLTYWFQLARKFRKVTPCNTARSDL